MYPNTSYNKYFDLANISESKNALKLFELGIKLLEKIEKDEKKVKKTKSQIYSAIGELYMTDLYLEKDA